MSNVVPFSTLLRERSSGAHSASEGEGFMSGLLKGEGTRDDYVSLVAQHYFIYRALEGAAERMASDPIAAPFITDRLTRLPALEADLEFLIGPDWAESVRPLPTTARYVARIEEVGTTWPGGFIAHHYTRYLGDLSGGIFIGRVMQRRFGFETNGVGFYLYGEIATPSAFRAVYREQLDAAGWDEDERERVIAEVAEAYRLTTAVFRDLAGSRAAA